METPVVDYDNFRSDRAIFRPVGRLLGTCRLQGIDPYVYLVDVLQRVETHPASQVEMLTPGLWKEHFASNPLGSNLDRLVYNAGS
jgi:hypothetical protein